MYYTGAIIPWPCNTSVIPYGCKACAGQILKIADYQLLYGVIGNIYGGDPSNGTFALPNLYGFELYGGIAAVGADPGKTAYNLGKTGGENTVLLNSNTMPSHDHAVVATLQGSVQGTLPPVIQVQANLPVSTAPGNTNKPGPQSVPAKAPNFDSLGLDNSLYGKANGTAKIPISTSQVPYPVLADVNIAYNNQSQPAGGTTAHSNMMPSLRFAYVICYEGAWPWPDGENARQDTNAG